VFGRDYNEALIHQLGARTDTTVHVLYQP